MLRAFGLIILILCLSGCPIWADGVQVEIDGNSIPMDSFTGTAFIDTSGRVMVPLRVVAEKAGKSVSYDSVNRVAAITDGDKIVSVPIGKAYVIINREIKPNDAPARIVNDRAYLPIRIVMEALGYQVRWDGGLSKVIITSAPEKEPEPAAEVPTINIPNTKGNTNINLYNGGLMTRENEDLYFVNFEDGERIWRINLKTGISNRISKSTARGINVVDGWVYYRQETPHNTWELFKTRLDGTGTQMVGTGNTQWLKVDSGYLYYYLSDEEALYRMKLTDPYSAMYYDQAMSSINLENGWLIYVEMEEDGSGKELPGDIIKVDITTREVEVLSSERTGTAEPFAALIGDTLYFTRYNDALSLYAMDLENGEIKKINDRWTYNVTGDGQNMYTLYPDVREGLYRIDPAKMAETELSNAWRPGTYHNPGITLVDSKVYFLKKVTSTRYGWLCYDLITGKLRNITAPADFLE